MWFVDVLLNIWAYLPVFALTDDVGFLTSRHGSEQSHRYYFSLISILFGEKKIQLISFPIKQPGEKIILFRIKRLSEMDNFTLSDEKAEQLETDYKSHFSLLDDTDQNIEKEALLRHLSEQKSRIEISYNKINAFTTIIVAVIPIAIAFIDWNTIKSLNVIGMVVFVLLIYANVNLCAWIFQAINVRGFMASSFGDLKKSEDKTKEQNWQIYYDWQQTKRKADMYVSFVKYTKVWIISVIILTVVFSIGLPFNEKNIVDTVNNHVYTLQTELIEKTYDESAVAWSFVLAELQTDKYAEMIILYNEADVSDIAEKLEQFRQQRIVWMTDNTLKKNEIKIILEE